MDLRRKTGLDLLPDTIGGPTECARVEINAGQTFFMSRGWLHEREVGGNARAWHRIRWSSRTRMNFLPGFFYRGRLRQLAVRDNFLESQHGRFARQESVADIGCTEYT